jgi:hypothetical protein
MKNLHKFTASLVIHWQLVDVATLATYHFGGSKNPMRPEIYNRKDIMLRKFIVEVNHYNLSQDSVKREHIIYMPEQEYDKSGSRYRNHRWVEKKLEEKIGKRYVDGSYTSLWYINRIYQERL